MPTTFEVKLLADNSVFNKTSSLYRLQFSELSIVVNSRERLTHLKPIKPMASLKEAADAYPKPSGEYLLQCTYVVSL